MVHCIYVSLSGVQIITDANIFFCRNGSSFICITIESKEAKANEFYREEICINLLKLQEKVILWICRRIGWTIEIKIDMREVEYVWLCRRQYFLQLSTWKKKRFETLISLFLNNLDVICAFLMYDVYINISYITIND